jgi:hypothetical protein
VTSRTVSRTDTVPTACLNNNGGLSCWPGPFSRSLSPSTSSPA